ncbi:ribosome modulation factor [Methylobacterium sp. CM6244]
MLSIKQERDMSSKSLAKALQRERFESDGSAFSGGRAAFFANKRRSECPFTDFDRREAWLRGWDEAQTEYQAS